MKTNQYLNIIHSCIICHSQEIETKRVDEQIKINTDIVYIPVSIPVCQNCGERYYDRKTMQYLENTRKKLDNNQYHLKEIGKVLTVEE